ncbi:dihydrodipicolinate synthase family protein [Pseudomonas sp. CFBP 13602]|uniref:dihydrodipicolinate synthase family protein n=1 Tax=Pseudomonas sp. CFBP 13602 TaxID=2774039 RepID=UPI00177AA403|nr:dihydrodipicolinate synthase family protein [Pseudomonas sp. CFBP 13602]MBD8825445.1 dihydrodipicolinate synthase family protein [Pseudomonas sp. CFBP 13602]
MFTGLSAFPLTPLRDGVVDETAFAGLIENLSSAKVDSIGVLGSTGSYAYLNRKERRLATQLAVSVAGEVPVIVGIGSVATRDVLLLAEDAQAAGACALLLPPVSYQKLGADEVFEFYETLAHHVSVPLVVYDNPGTTHFEFTDELHGRIAALPNVASIKIPGMNLDPAQASARVARLRASIPAHVSIGISGDAFAVTGLNAGCELWYSVLGGLFPRTALALIEATKGAHSGRAVELSAGLEPLWAMFREYGSVRVIAAAAEIMGQAAANCLPLPLKGLDRQSNERLVQILKALELA